MTVITAVEVRVVVAARPAAIVIVTTSRGALGFGEAAPLSGRSPDDVADAVRAATALAARVPMTLEVDLAAVAALAASVTRAPAARFAIETAVLDAVARERSLPLADLLGAAPVASVPINAVVDDAPAARRAVQRGIATVKVKLRGSDPAQFARDRATLAAIRDAVGPAVRLRADVNRGWPAALARDRLAALVALDLEYVEEPCHGAADLLGAPVAIALDETLAELDDAALDRSLAGRGIAAVIIKPTLVGGLARALAIATIAARHRVDVVVTHALEGPIATAACAELARALGCRRACGLDAHAGLVGWTRAAVPQLAAATVIAAPSPGLGLDHAALRADLAALEAR